MMKVNLEYFKKTGRYYSECSYVTTKEHLYEIFEEVRNLKEAKMLPGLVKGHSEFIVHIDVPEHPNNHPKLIV